VCAEKKKEGNKAISESRLVWFIWSGHLNVQKHHVSIPYTNTASNTDTSSISVLKNIERALRELEDTPRVSFDFATQIMLNVLVRELAMVTTNLHHRPDFHR